MDRSGPPRHDPPAAQTRRRAGRAAWGLAAWLLALLVLPGAAHAAIVDAVRVAIATAPGPAPGRSPLPAGVRRAVADAWEARGNAPRFVEPAAPHAATPRARELVAALAEARTRGLDPAAYDPAALHDALDAPRDEAGAARLEAALALALGRYLADVGFGRVDPRTLGHDLPQQRRRDALGPALRAALDAPDAAAAVASVEPTLPLYRALLAALADWRVRAAEPEPPRLPAVRGKVSPGDAWAGVDALRARLAATGDLPETAARGAAQVLPQAPAPAPTSAQTSGPSTRYEGGLVDAVRAFQARHGLDADGVLGARTLEALQVPASRRVRQIELSLERVRWIGDVPAGRFVAINIPEFRLWAVEGGRAALSMAVVVGKAVSGTPVFVDAIEAVEFNPYWNVPRSIASNELYPKIARNPGYLASQHMELVGAEGDGLRAALASGAARIRQRPGDDNALGKLKFRMPNAHDVYLHDTPARSLFAASRRDFSHGCIRLQRPRELAAWALAGRPEWTPARIDEAIAVGRNQAVAVAAPIPVLILYSTVNVGEDGRVRFLPDVYGHDARLDAALAGPAR
jgi:murein L,D-transpeptidase YcbB/YkuD